MRATAAWPRGSLGLALFVAGSIALLVAFAPAWRAVRADTGRAWLHAPLPVTVPAGTVLRVGDPVTKWIFQHNGWERKLPFRIEWAEITGGPDTTEAFHAGALDVGFGAKVPPIHADWAGLPVRIVATRSFAERGKAAWVFGIAPGAGIRRVADLRGKRIAFSPSQVQAEVVLETLRAAGLRPADVTLVELPSSIGGDVYTSALASGAVDAAPINAGIVAQRYLSKFGERGARLLAHPPFRDDGVNVYVPEGVLADPAKAAALRVFVVWWGRAQAWANAHPQSLAEGYFAAVRGLPKADARVQVDALFPVAVPRDWREAVAAEQRSIDLLAPVTGHQRFDAADLFDHRFETVAAEGAAGA